MIPAETPVGARVRAYVVQGDESSSWVGRTRTPVVDGFVTVQSEFSSGIARVPVAHVEPIGARPFVSHKVTCPQCAHEFER